MHSVSLLALCICALAASGRGEVIQLTDLNFDELVTRGGVWFIDVYAPWWAMSTRTEVDMQALGPRTEQVYQSSSCLYEQVQPLPRAGACLAGGS